MASFSSDVLLHFQIWMIWTVVHPKVCRAGDVTPPTFLKFVSSLTKSVGKMSKCNVVGKFRIFYNKKRKCRILWISSPAEIKLLPAMTAFNPKAAGGGGGRVNLTPPTPYGFLKNVSSRERVKSWGVFVTFNIIIMHIFPENFIEIPQVV